MKKSLLFIAIIFCLSSQTANAQKWVQMMTDPNSNFFEVQKEFYAYWKDRKVGKGQGYKQFKRWEYYMQSRVDKNGKLPPAGYAQAQLQQFEARHAQEKMLGPIAAWTPIGPASATQLPGGVGRVQCLAWDATAPNTYWAGTPSGGLWKSTDAGVSWVPKTDNFVSLGISWILIDPTNVNTMYVSTGDPDQGNPTSTGVLKSTDGGNTWVQTGLNFTTNQYKQIYQLKFLPGNAAVILAATTDGIYRSANGGTTWTLVKSGLYVYDMEFHPITPSIVYAATNGAFLKSVDSGVTWTDMTSGIVTNGNRTSLEVTASAPDNVYCVTTENNDFKTMFKSTNKGVSFAAVTTSVSIGQQGWYDLTFKVSPVNQNIMYFGGVWMNKTTDGGVTWNNIYDIHADNHNMFFYGTKEFICNDGGLYRSSDNGTTWEFIVSNMQIMQFYRISSYPYDYHFLIGGSQDNGTSRFKNNVWKQINGADGMDNAVSSQSSDVVWTSFQNGPLYKSTDGGITNSSVNGNINENGAWVTPFVMSPTNHDIVYAGFESLWKTTVGGTTWTKLSAPQTGSLIEKIVVDWSNPSIIYAMSGAYWKSTNGGTSWVNISTGTDAPVGRAITIDPKNSSRVWVAGGGFNAGKKMYFSSNGGTTWSNISGTLPDLPINVITYVPGSNDGIYIGTDQGIFYKDASMTDWVQFNNGLPNVRIDDLEINIGAGKIIAGTYGRGMWESPLRDDANAKPIADFDASSKGGCPGISVTFTNFSANSTSWSWSFPGGTPSTSTLKNPVVTYSTVGNYDVTLVATSTSGNSTKTRTGLISISGQVINAFPYAQNFESETVGSTTFTGGWLNGTDDQGNWIAHTGMAPERVNNPMVGPTGDHTTGQGKYLLFESVSAPYSSINLYSPCFNLSGVTNPILEFYEHVWGTTNAGGELHLDILSNGGWTLDVIPMVDQLGDFWFKKTVDLSAYANQMVKFRFRVLSAYSKDFALDDISIKSKPTVAPVADFFATVTSGFLGFSTQFYDQSSNVPTSYSWSFPGGTPASSTLANPQVVYNTGGIHNVSLTATNAYGSHTATKTAYISVNDAVFNMNNQTVTNCIGQVFDPAGPNGNYINNESKTFTIIPSGGQQVILRVKDWGVLTGDYVTVFDGTSVNAPVIANWTGGFVVPYGITSNSGAMTIRFTSDGINTSTGFQLEWNAIGGTCSPGTTVPKPVAAFSSAVTTAVAPASFTLKSNSTNAPTGLTWITPGAENPYYYGDEPWVNYTTPGTYDVTLVAVNEGGRDTLKKTAFFTVTEYIPEVNMYSGTETTCKGNLYDDGGPTANYTNSKTYTLVIQPAGVSLVTMAFSQWGLESGYDFLKIYNGTSVSAPLIGNYSATTPGTVTANSGAMTLRFTSDGGTTGIGWKAAWSATGGNCSPVIAPVANFSATPTTVNTGAPVQFTDLSTNTPTSWSWSFTGGTPATSTVKNPSVTYAAAGTYAVTLTATNAAGSNTITKTAYITVNQVITPVANFSATPTTVNTGAPVQFTDLSTNTPTSWSWSFTGGTPATSTVKNPSVTYAAAGTYAVSLTATNTAGSNTTTKTGYITVTAAATVINMQNATVTSCTGTLYDDGGASANYTNSKTYTLVIQPSGATSVSLVFSQWGLESGYDFLKIYNGTSVSAPLLGNYSASTPGTVTANSGAMTLRFTSDASTTGIGWKSTWSATGGSCSTPVIPVADFSASPTTVSTGTPVQFSDLSTNTPTTWSWSFTGGTPATSTVKNPSVTYAAAGTYAVSLTATNAAGSNTITKTAYITVTQVVAPVANFSATPTSVSTGAAVQFTDLSTNTPTSWSWSFTGGTPATSTVKNPSVTYAAGGTYAVSLTASNAGGSNTNTKTGYITVTTAATSINMQNATVTTCTGTLYDDGGASANYTNSKTYTLLIQPAGATSVSMVFSQWGLESGYDFLKIYNGTSVSAPLLGNYSASTPGTVTANSGAMTLRFTSDGGVTGIGWKSTWNAVGCTTPFSEITTAVTTPTDNEKAVQIYPNPTYGEFKVMINNKKFSQLIIKNITGQIVEKMMIAHPSFDVNLTAYPKGLYFLELSGTDGVQTEKVIVQ